MMCSCGGITGASNKVVRSNVLQGEYQKCRACGRIHWEWRTEELKESIRREQMEAQTKKESLPANE